MTYINDWVLAGAGMEGESYTSESHPELIMKVSTVEDAGAGAVDEFDRTMSLLQCGVSIPRIVEITRFKGRPAMISQRVLNKKSFCRLAGERPELIPELARRMATMVKELHGKKVEGFPSALEKYRKLLESNTVLDDMQKKAVGEALVAIEAEDQPAILHGDLHFGNIITDGSKDYFIDLGDVCCGNPNHDLAMFYIATHYGSAHSFDFLYHLSWPQALEFWDRFKKAYFGWDIPDAVLFSQLKNYMYARCVWFKEPQIQTELCSILCRKDAPLTAEIKLKVLGE